MEVMMNYVLIKIIKSVGAAADDDDYYYC